MPPTRKTREQAAAESFSNIGFSDIKDKVEKPVKESVDRKDVLKNVTEKTYKKPKKSELETVVKPGTKKKTAKKKSTSKKKTSKKKTASKKKSTSKKKSAKKKTSSKSNSVKAVIDYQAPDIKLKQNGYELIITEKPQAANKIANALGKAVQKNLNKAPYYEVDRNGHKIIVACAVGHLFTLKQLSQGSNYPKFDIKWVPNYLARKKDFTKRYYDLILSLVKKAGSITIATDYDVEGEVIGLNVMKYICNQTDAARMKFSTLTQSELDESYENRFENIDWGQAFAGETRHHLDWFYGINLSRALMDAIKTTGRFKIMSIGRVQGPALQLIVKREKEIQAFNPQPYWQVFISIDTDKGKVELKHNKDIFNKENLKKFENLIGKNVDVETTKKEQKLPPNPPFNLTTLQTEAHKLYGISPSRTLQIAQGLYLNGLISYPRTSSQKLPASIGYKKILNKIAKQYKAQNLITRKKPIEGKKDDPAHPSIYPTGNTQILSGEDEKLYNLIATRFISLFCDDAIVENKKISATTKDQEETLKFASNGKEIKQESWLKIYPSRPKEEFIPDINGEHEITDLRQEKKETQPPKRYSSASIVSELEKRGLGTKATRSNILETLYNRGYIEGKQIKATPLGIALIDTLEKHSPIITDEKLTREFEEDMEKIQEKKSKQELEQEENKVIDKAKKTISDIAEDFKTNKEKIGQEIMDANSKYIEEQKRQNRIKKCPKCEKGYLGINYSKKNGRYFVACDAYPECKNTYPLPPAGQVKTTDKVCEECGTPMLMRLTKGKKPWTFCWNTECPTNASWANKSAKQNSEENTEKSKTEQV
ncbi:MAG: DNA topoisomerase I [Candidatus Pacearchaeota archaeon]